MNLRTRLAIWLLKGYAVTKPVDVAELIIFFDPSAIDTDYLQNPEEGLPESACVTMIAAHKRADEPLSNSFFVVQVPKRT